MRYEAQKSAICARTRYSVLAQQTKQHTPPNSNEDEFSLAEYLKTYQPRKEK
jgi:hypothetical protein